MSSFLSLQPNTYDLHQGVVAGDEDMVRSILDVDTADVNGTVCGATSLALCLYKQKQHIFSLLIQHEKCKSRLDLDRLSMDDKMRKEPPIIIACRHGNVEAVRLLAVYGANLDAMDCYGHTALWMATRQKALPIAKLLVENGASVNPSNLWTESPLYLSVEFFRRRTPITQLLLYHGVRLDIIKGQSLFYHAIMAGAEVTFLLLETGYNVSGDAKVRNELATGRLTSNPDVLQMVEYAVKYPTDLITLCRFTIRNHISKLCKGQHFILRMRELEVPPTVLPYLLMEHLNPRNDKQK